MAAERVIPIGSKNGIDENDVYVTYDIDEAGGTSKPVIYQVAKKVPIRGTVTSWDVGEFKIRGVEEIYGVNIKY